MRIHCPTEKAVFLLACVDAHGVFRFPHSSDELPGIMIDVKSGLAIDPQLIQAASDLIATDNLGQKLSIEQGFTGECQLQDGSAATLYCGVLPNSKFTPPDDWMTISTIIRSLMKSPNRVTYMKALQVFSGGLNNDLRAVVPEHLTEDSDSKH